MSVAPPDRLYFREPLAGDRHDHSGAMGWIMHRRQAVPPSRKTTFVKTQRRDALVVILGFRVEDGTEFPLARPFAARYDFWSVIARLGHHVLQAGGLYHLEKPFELLDRQAGRNRADDVFARLQGFHVHPNVKRQRRKNSYSFQSGVLEKIVEVLILRIAAVNLRQALQSVRAKVAYSRYFAIWM